MECEEHFKKIELKVSANCCEGCKRKVKKALRNLEGVVNINIDPLEPKITVFGKMNPHMLIKRLQKVGKHSELLNHEEVEAEEKEETINQEIEQEKQPHPHHFKIEKTKDATCKKKASKDTTNNMSYSSYYRPQELKREHYLPNQEVNFMAHQNMMNPYSNTKTHPQYCYIAQPCAVALPYIAIPSYSAPPLPQDCVEGHCHFDIPRLQPPFLRPIVQVGDYFSDENTMGCHVM
ncbi:hypothetical protein VNO78_33190 [Psophocarpus tetragonolobus]|uniref:HMA domain-containing protein n=1 Tax=Psophocarpus tetragonolobus TaxID=3891 RepID=A0AAN9RL47_PSOTE